ncbi:MAG: aspartate--tRNA ligase, partial [Alphaproteobacteria bacterium]
IDRIVMMLADEPNLREIVAFPLNQQAEDVMMGAPAPIDAARQRELHIRVVEPPRPVAPAVSGPASSDEPA